VLKATRVVLVEHMDEVLREALAMPDPDAVFGPPRESWEYIDGELVVRGQGVPTPGSPARPPARDPWNDERPGQRARRRAGSDRNA